jgi:hypothetical protein
MEESRNIIWLASYPKSGNTWFRAILAYLYRNETFDINNLDISPIYSSRTFIENEGGVDTTELTAHEAEDLRISVFDRPFGTFPSFFKIHDAFTFLPGNRPVIPAHQTFAAVYFIRNPLDVAVSFAYHSAKTVEKTIENMGNEKFFLAASSKKYNNQLRQMLLSWSGHVKSWTEQSLFPVKVLRYEDMLTDPHRIFSETITGFLQLPFGEKEISEAVEACRFEKLSRLEKEKGFREKAPGCESFFRKGVAGDYKNHLSDEMIRLVTNHHSDIMKQYNYL